MYMAYICGQKYMKIKCDLKLKNKVIDVELLSFEVQITVNEVEIASFELENTLNRVETVNDN